MSKPTSPNRDHPFRKITVVRKGKPYRATTVNAPGALSRAILEDGAFATVQSVTFATGLGVTWIDGHHDYDSDEVKALLAANALEGREEEEVHAPAFRMPPIRMPAVTYTANTSTPEARYPVGMFSEDD